MRPLSAAASYQRRARSAAGEAPGGRGDGAERSERRTARRSVTLASGDRAAAQMAASLGLAPHPEGGYYLETYRAAQTLRTPRGERPASTAILFPSPAIP